MEPLKNRSVEKVVLVAPPMRPEDVWGKVAEWGEVTPPIALCYIAAYIREQGYAVSIVDAEALRYNLAQTVEHIVDEKPDVVGFTCKTLWVTSAHRVATALKERIPDVLIVAGGHHPTALPQRTLKEFPNFDVLVLGEGEVTLLELLQAMNNGKDIAEVDGLAFARDGEPYFTPPRVRIKDLDVLPMPALDLLPPLKTHYLPSLVYGVKGASFPLMTSRGCPHQCTFCDRGVYGNRVTFHSPEYVMSLVEHLHRHHKVRHLVICDDNFLLKRSHMLSILDAFKSSGLNLKFVCQSRADTIDEERLQRLKEAGCDLIMIGIESASQTILNKMKKDITPQQVRKAVEMAHKAGLKVDGLFMLGFPGETEETLKETENFIRECKFEDIMCWFFTPLPGSEIYQDIEKYGTYHEDFEKSNSTEPNVFVPHGTTPELLNSYMWKYQTACYMRAYQLRLIPRRIPTMRHFKAFVKSFFIQP